MVIKLKKSTETFDFGWSLAWMNVYWIVGTIFACVAIWFLVNIPCLPLIPIVFILVAINLYGGNWVWRKSRSQHFLTLPFTDLFSSDHDVILDACCGSGRTTIALGKIMKNGRIFAVDRFDASYIKNGGRELLARNLSIAGIEEKVEIKMGDVTHLDFKDNTFDAAVSTYAIDHMKKQKLPALREITRVVKVGGKFLLVVFVPNFFTFLIANVFCLGLPSKSKWRKLFPQSNLRITDEGDINGGAYFLLEKIS